MAGISTEVVPVLWFDAKGRGPDELAFQLHPFPAERDGAIPASLGIRVRAGELVIGAGSLVDGGFNLGREQVETLYRLLGQWLGVAADKERVRQVVRDAVMAVCEHWRYEGKAVETAATLIATRVAAELCKETP